MEVEIQKKTIRAEMFKRRNAIDVSFKERYDSWVNEALIHLVRYRNFQTVHVYIPMLSEINIRPFIQHLLSANKTVVAPKTLPKRKLENRILQSLTDLETGIMGTQYPAIPDIYAGVYDLIVVPGLAFDQNLYRLGYGGGYYDGFLANQPHALKVGIFYPFQEIEHVPRESHDMKMDEIIINKDL